MTALSPALDPVWIWLARLALLLLFASSALHKLRDFAAFRATLGEYRLLPGALVAPAALLLIAAEVSLAAGLLVSAFWGPTGTLGSCAILLLGAYSAAIAANLWRGRRDIDCGCLGPARRQPLSGWLLIRNAALVAAATPLLFDPAPRALSWVDGVSIAGGLGAGVLFWNAAHALGASAARAALSASTRTAAAMHTPRAAGETA